jgi:hypothetical protein
MNLQVLYAAWKSFYKEILTDIHPFSGDDKGLIPLSLRISGNKHYEYGIEGHNMSKPYSMRRENNLFQPSAMGTRLAGTSSAWL